jgi:hypothetical protein
LAIILEEVLTLFQEIVEQNDCKFEERDSGRSHSPFSHNLPGNPSVFFEQFYQNDFLLLRDVLTQGGLVENDAFVSFPR